MRTPKDTPSSPGRAARIAQRVRQYPAWWLGEVKRGHGEGQERADQARAEYQEARNAREAPGRETRTPRGRTR